MILCVKYVYIISVVAGHASGRCCSKVYWPFHKGTMPSRLTALCLFPEKHLPIPETMRRAEKSKQFRHPGRSCPRGLLHWNPERDLVFLQWTPHPTLEGLRTRATTPPNGTKPQSTSLVCLRHPSYIFSKTVLIDVRIRWLRDMWTVKGGAWVFFFSDTHFKASQKNAVRCNLEHMLRVQTVNA